jgi:hypothetical protein
VLVGTERHLHAVEIADDTVKAAKQAGLDTVAALLLTGTAGAVHVTADVMVIVGVAVIVVGDNVWILEVVLLARRIEGCVLARRPTHSP